MGVNGDSSSKTSEILKSALKFISGEAKHVCRLCFAAADEDGVELHDSIKIERPYMDVKVTFMTMLLDLGIDQEPLLPQKLCLACATTVMNSFLFRHLCEYSNKQWAEAMDKLEDSLKHTEDRIKYNAKALYLKIDDKTNFITKKTSKSKSEAIKSLKTAISNKDKYRKFKSKTKFICEECGKHFCSKCALKRHAATQHTSKEQSCTCKLCNKTFTTSNHLNDHLERIHMPKTIPCKHCSKKFGSERMLKAHKNYYHIPVICKTCSARVPSRYQMVYHAAKHVKYSCQKCNRTVSTAHSLYQHRRICRMAQEKQYICDICNNSYYHKRGIQGHMIRHGFGVGVTCKWCGKKFPSKHILELHAVKHTRERNFFCETCGGKFVTKAALLYHTRIHTGERPYSCEECGERFLSASRRMDHIRRKHMEPTKKCPYCPSKFVAKNSLTKHVRRHFNPESKLFMPSVQTNKVVTVKNET